MILNEIDSKRYRNWMKRYQRRSLIRPTRKATDMPLLEITNLHASVGGHEILKGVNLTIEPGEVHAIMGLNGSGKSTLARVLAGHDAYEVTAGSVTFDGKDLLELEADERACEGIFMAFQYPVEIPGVRNTEFLKASINAVRKYRGLEELDAVGFLKVVRETMKEVDMPEDLLRRSVNEGFSGGEKKKHEVFQMSLLHPRFAILDETDSGLDIDALRTVADGVNKMRDNERSFMVITHYQRLLEYIIPDVVHVMIDGRIVKSGPKELAIELDTKGYDWVREEVSAAAAN